MIMLNRYLNLITQFEHNIIVNPDISKLACSIGMRGCENVEDALKLIKYIVLRHDEHGDTNLDKYGRFNRKDSVLAKFNLDNRPIIDELVLEIINQLGISKINFWPDNKRAAVCLTHDVDAFYGNSYLILRQIFWLAKSLKSLSSLNFDEFKITFQKIRKWSNFKKKKSDPKFAFDKWLELENKYGFTSTFFLMSLKYALGKDGIRYSIHEPKVRETIKMVNNSGWEIGLHADIFNNLDAKYLRAQKNNLEDIIGKSIIGCRQHYLNVRLPESWILYEESGIKYSSNMGWSDFNGFRAGTCIPYNPLDFYCTNEKSSFLEIPFQFMDDHMILDTDEYLKCFLDYLEKIKKVGGCLVIDFHQEHFDEEIAPGVNTTYREMLNVLANDKEIIVCKLEDVYSYLIRNK